MEDDEKEAIREAVDTLHLAQKMAELQVKQELSNLDLTEGEGDGDPADEATLQAFWLEQGLSKASAAKLASELCRSERRYSTTRLGAIVQRWQGVLPDENIAELVAQDCDLLQQSVPRAVGNLICLVAGLPGKDVMGMVGKLPRLLWMDDLPRRLAQTVDKLLQLHPSKSVSIVHELCAENPQLLHRIPDYYMHVTIIDELPIELQNWLTISDKGIGFLYSYFAQERGANNSVKRRWSGSQGEWN